MNSNQFIFFIVFALRLELRLYGWLIDFTTKPHINFMIKRQKKKIVRSLNSISNTIVFKNSELMNYMELYNVTSTVNLSSNRQQFNFTKKIYLSLGLNIFKLENFYLNTLNLYISFFLWYLHSEKNYMFIDWLKSVDC